MFVNNLFDTILPMKLILVRHGEHFDNSLTIKGVKQAVEVAAKLADTKISAIYCSPTGRCEQTLDEILRIRSDMFPISMSRLLAPKTNLESLEKLKSRVTLFVDDLKYEFEQDDTVVAISHLAVIRMISYLVNGQDRELEMGEMTEIAI